ncbi:MAG: hypothetical protein ACYS8I_17150 [Planctomycetota bacterium]|jgi:hypothetical protein
MNKKQLVTVWVGVALIIILVCFRMYHIFWRLNETNPCRIDPKLLWRYLLFSWDLPLVVAALAVALTCTFADKKPKDEQKQ